MAEILKLAHGRHTRRAELAGLRRVCLAALIMLVGQYGLGIVLNLYVPVPASDEHAGLMREIASGPLTLTVHALLGVALIVTAIALLARAVAVGDRLIAVLAAAGLTAIGGAFASGEIFVHSGKNTASLAMALLTGVALLCYIGALSHLGSARRRAMRMLPPSNDELGEDGSYPGPAWLPPDWRWSPRANPPRRVVPARDDRLVSPISQAPASWFTPE
jgi:hypothetical protein